MIYLLYGEEQYLIQKKLKEIIEKNQIDDINISKYNLEETLLTNIIEDASIISLFDEKKIIVVDNSYIFTRSTNKYTEQDTDYLLKYFENPNPNTVLIFIVRENKIDNVKKISKLIKEKGQVLELNVPKNINQYVSKLFDDYKISDDNINLLIKRIGMNLGVLEQEISKLKLYKIDNKDIIKDDIINLTSQNIDVNIFNFVDNIINKNKTEAMKTYQELLKLNEEPIKIIIMLANKFRMMYQACELTRKGLSIDDIANILNTKRYPIQLAIEKGFKYESEILLKKLEELADLDSNIKMGLIDKEIALELFILRL